LSDFAAALARILPHLLSTSCNVLSSFSRFPFVICGHLLSVEKHQHRQLATVNEARGRPRELSKAEQARMTEQALNRIQRAFLDRELAAKKRGDPDATKLWAEAQDVVQEEKRRVFGAPEVAA
jgi:hypothetical protein